MSCTEIYMKTHSVSAASSKLKKIKKKTLINYEIENLLYLNLDMTFNVSSCRLFLTNFYSLSDSVLQLLVLTLKLKSMR